MEENLNIQQQEATKGTGYVVLICIVATLGGLLFGYDTAVISGAIGFVQDNFELTAAMKGWAASSALLGCVIGVATAGILSDLFGRKKVLILAAVFFLISAIGTALPRTLTQFVIFRIIGGVGVGAASIISPLYIAEITPARIRGRMVSVNQFTIIFGMLVVYFVNFFIARSGTSDWNVEVGWRWMFGSESLPAILFLAALLLVPESPRWLAEQNLKEKALGILTRIGGRSHAEKEMNEIEKVIAQEETPLAMLFNPRMRIVLLIGIVLAVLQQVTGINVFLYYAPEIFKQISGSGTSAALLQTIIVGVVNLTFTVVAIWTVDKLGRKPLMIVGAAGMGLCLTAMGITAFMGETTVWILIFVLGYIAAFALSVGPVTWVILSEIFPTKIRGRAMAIAAFFLWTANYIVSQTFPMLDENPWLVEKFNHAFPFWLYAGLCFVEVIFVWMVLPETKGKTLEEIEEHWIS